MARIPRSNVTSVAFSSLSQIEAEEAKKKGKPQASVAKAPSKPAAGTGEEEWTAARVFDLSDADNSGYLDLAELEFALTSVLGKVVTRTEVDKLMKKFDTDGNGNLDKAEFEKFAEALKKQKGGLKAMFSMKSTSAKKAEAAIVENQRQSLLTKDRKGAVAGAAGGNSKPSAAKPTMSKQTEEVRNGKKQNDRLIWRV